LPGHHPKPASGNIGEDNPLCRAVLVHPPVDRWGSLASARFGRQIRFHLDRERTFLVGGIGDQIYARVCRHGRGIDTEAKKLVLHQKLAQPADLLSRQPARAAFDGRSGAFHAFLGPCAAYTMGDSLNTWSV